MFKKICISLLLIFFIFNNAIAEVIKSIKVDGNKNINTDTIILFSGLRIGSDINQIELNESVKLLYETDFFKDIKVKFENSNLTFTVSENLIIQNLIITGIKRKPVQKLLYKEIALKDSSPFIESKAIADVVRIKKILQSVGYYFTKVDSFITENLNGTVNLTFDIALGKKSYIDEILFIGDKKIKSGKLSNIIASEEYKFWKILSNKKFLDEERINLDKRLLVNYYKNKGYYNINVKNSSVKQNNNENFQLIFNIDSGPKFFFNTFKINLPDDYDPKFFNKIEKKLNKNKGSIYSYGVLEKTLKEIENIASNENYEFIDATIDEQIVDKNKIDISINLSESKKIYISKINILGNNVTIDDVIRNELIVDEGDPLNNILLNKSINRIKSLGIFKNVGYELKNIENNSGLKHVNINVEEKPTGQISLGAGIGSAGASTNFGIQENNFLGRGIKLDTNVTLGEDSLKGIFSIVNTNFKNSDKDLIFSVQSSEDDRFKDYGYKTNKHGLSLGTRFEHLDSLFITPTFDIFYENLETISTASNSLKKQNGNYFDVEFGYVFDLDKRNQTYNPSDGFRSTFRQTLPIISDGKTILNSYEFNSYAEYLPDLIGSASFFAKVAHSLDDTDVRISDRVYIPSKKLRGFQPGKVGPIDGSDFVGGNYATTINLAGELPVLQSFDNAGFKLFLDIANVWGIYDSSLDDSSKIRSATGVSVDWFTPIGPLNFSLTQPITKKDTDKTESFRFSLGTTF